MNGVLMLVPNLVKAGFKVWETSKEWSAKKRIASFAIAPAALILFSIVVGVFGEHSAQIAAQILTEVMLTIADAM
jgi:hypothetical protein